jgi:hypothetical protein
VHWNAVKTFAVVLSAAIIINPADKTKGNTFYNVPVGFKITKPDSWKITTVAPITNPKGRVRLTSQELLDIIQKRGDQPFVAINRFDESYRGFNPKVQVVLRSLTGLEGKTSEEILNLLLPQLKKSLKNFTNLSGVRKTSISGIPGAMVWMKHTLTLPDGKSVTVVSKMLAAIRGPVLFQIGASLPDKPSPALKKDMEQVLRSMVIEE